ncbi:MAG: hypothetical protein U5K79_08410 [Cyclobacteriaceae bacterium]|nr:hypothetical protein [Cyclobacteriaceae bacterium]
MNDDVVDVRKMIPEATGMTYTIIASTHTHEAADLDWFVGKNTFEKAV